MSGALWTAVFALILIGCVPGAILGWAARDRRRRQVEEATLTDLADSLPPQPTRAEDRRERARYAAARRGRVSDTGPHLVPPGARVSDTGRHRTVRPSTPLAAHPGPLPWTDDTTFVALPARIPGDAWYRPGERTA